MDEKYGWTNYETWLVALWIGNDQGSQSYWDEVAQECYDRAEAGDVFTRDEQAALDLSDCLKNEISDEGFPLPEGGLYADLLNGALSEVNWHEIAEHYIEDVEKEEAEADA